MSDPWPDLAGRLTEFGHLLPVRVYYEDTDFSGRVYHASYLRFMERGRSDFLRLRGIRHDLLAASDRLAFAVRHMAIDFLRAAGIDDLLEIETRVGSVQGARAVLRQRVLRGSEPLVEAEVTVVLLDETGRPRRISPAMRSRLLLADRAPVKPSLTIHT